MVYLSSTEVASPAWTDESKVATPGFVNKPFHGWRTTELPWTKCAWTATSSWSCTWQRSTMRARTKERQCISTAMQRSAQHRERMSAASRVASVMAGDQDSMKLRLLSRIWLDISKFECAVLILRPSIFRAAVVKRLVPASLNAWRHRTASVEKDADGWKWSKPKKHWKNLQKPWKAKNTLEKPKKQKKQFSESLGWDPPSPKSLEILLLLFFFWFFQGFFFWFSNVFVGFSKVFLVSAGFSKVFPKCGVLQGNWHESQAKLSKCLWECSKTSVNFKRSS